METIDFKSPNIGSNDILNFNKFNKPTIGYNWSTCNKDNKRTLVDIGTLPRKDAELYFGRGIKFNGVDQKINIQFPITTFPFTFIETGVSGQFWNIKMWRNSSGSISWYDIDNNYKASSIMNDYKDDPIAVVVHADNRIDLYGRGEYITSIENVITEYYINRIGQNTGGYIEGIARNMILIDYELTLAQIRYQYLHPEKFLYREDGVLKSKILTQSEIDKVKMYLPMCENSGYVCDLVNYTSGTLNQNVEYVYMSGAGDEPNTMEKVSDYKAKYHLEVETNHSYVPQVFLHIEEQDETDLYEITINLNVINGVVYCYPDVTSNSIPIELIGEHNVGLYEWTFIGNFKNSNNRIGLNFNGVDYHESDFTIELGCKKLTGVSQIENFTHSLRDKAKQLTTGLQTCFWKRDVLGVPYANSFNALVCANETTPFIIPITDAELLSNNGVCIELVFKKTYSKNNCYLFNSVTSDSDGKHAGIFIMLEKTWNKTQFTLYAYDTDGGIHYVSADIHDTDLHHVVFNIKPTELNLFLDGVHKSTATINDNSVAPSGKPIMGNINLSTIKGTLNILKFHVVSKDPLKLYDDAVKKGLLNE